MSVFAAFSCRGPSSLRRSSLWRLIARGRLSLPSLLPFSPHQSGLSHTLPQPQRQRQASCVCPRHSSCTSGRDLSCAADSWPRRSDCWTTSWRLRSGRSLWGHCSPPSQRSSRRLPTHSASRFSSMVTWPSCLEEAAPISGGWRPSTLFEMDC